jgi:hypothetical protein
MDDNLRTIGQNFMEFDIEEFYEELLGLFI